MLAFGFDLEIDELQAVVGFEARRRIAHVVEQVLLKARLVDDEVRELRQAGFGVLDAAGALDARSVALRRTPEDSLVDPIGLAGQLLSQTEGFEHFNCPTGDPVRLTDLERSRAPLDQSGADAGEIRQLRGEQRPCGSTADHENIDGIGKLLLGDVGVAGGVAIQIELHVASIQIAHGSIACSCARQVDRILPLAGLIAAGGGFAIAPMLMNPARVSCVSRPSASRSGSSWHRSPLSMMAP